MITGGGGGGGFEDEEKWLAEGIAAIQHNAFYMHRALVIIHLSLHNFHSINQLIYFPDPT